MKASNVQQEICDALISTIHCWKSTNDISSPTVSSDIDDCKAMALDDMISNRDLNLLNNYMHKVYDIVRNYDQEEQQ